MGFIIHVLKMKMICTVKNDGTIIWGATNIFPNFIGINLGQSFQDYMGYV